MFKIINSKKIINKNGNINKFDLTGNLFLNNIKDFYFSELFPGKTKGWKIKKIPTVVLVVEGKVIFEISNKNSFKKISLAAESKKILIIKKNINFRFYNLTKKKSVLISFLKKKYVKEKK